MPGGAGRVGLGAAVSTKATGADFEAVVAGLIAREIQDAVVHYGDPRAQRFGDDYFDCFDGVALSDTGTVWYQSKAKDVAPSAVWRAMVARLPMPPATEFRFYALHRARPTVLRVWRNRRLADGARAWEEREVEG